jgi:hypothetical protein
MSELPTRQAGARRTGTQFGARCSPGPLALRHRVQLGVAQPSLRGPRR